jgi:ABC-type branched-subunit amino acid transport system ATPase component
MTVPLLELEGVNAFYGAAHILHDMSLAVGEGERIALVGRNGVGKTTVVNALLGVASVRGGEIRIRGERFERVRGHTAATHGIAVVPQGRRILGNLTVEENLKLGAALRRKGPWSLPRVYELFPILAERAGHAGTGLSGGQLQMLAIGRALMANPDLLVLDEPTEGLAPVIVDEVARIVVDLAKTGVAVMLIEQHLKLVRAIAERHYVVSKGTVVETGATRSVPSEQLQASIMR